VIIVAVVKIPQERSVLVSEIWSKADLHIHTTYSDGTASVEAVLEYVATQTDLRAIAITDHDTIEGALEAHRLGAAYGIEVIVGEEVSTTEGHLLALFIEQPLAPKQSAAATIAGIHAQNGLCIPAHPYNWFLRSMGRAGLRERCVGQSCEWPVDAIESFNASLWVPRNNLMAAATGAALDLALVGGSDSHHLATLGLGYTLFPGRTAADLRCAIRMRTTHACGSYWRWAHSAEYVGLWVRSRAYRALRPAVS
jgi:predicted metal-dependent phosphoesterase TrpH